MAGDDRPSGDGGEEELPAACKFVIFGLDPTASRFADARTKTAGLYFTAGGMVTLSSACMGRRDFPGNASVMGATGKAL
jgi:hypothetical protein